MNSDLKFFHGFLKRYAERLADESKKDPCDFTRTADLIAHSILKQFEDTFLELKDIEGKGPKEGA